MRNVFATIMTPFAKLGGKKRIDLTGRQLFDAAGPTARIDEVERSRMRKQRAPRRDVFAHCKLSWSPDGSAEGMVLNISKTGALVRFPNTTSVPQQVRMRIPVHGINTTVTAVRKSGNDCAFNFQ